MKNLNLIFRKLWKNKLFTFLNIIGLAIGISACWIVFRLVNYELSFDKNHAEGEKIFKVYGVFDEVGSTDRFDGVPTPLARYIKENLSSVELSVPVNRTAPWPIAPCRRPSCRCPRTSPAPINRRKTEL